MKYIGNYNYKRINIPNVNIIIMEQAYKDIKILHNDKYMLT